ncbi:Ube2j2 [Symbiodinium sp. CCMP2456]|nr:Ube2j2 [Symbiodinium sp. CCMP2456]
MPAVDDGLGPGSFEDGAELARTSIPETATTVLLGECTHGTEEFYQIRAEITKYLMQTRGFNIILCESDWTFMWHVNQYVHRKKSNMFPDATRFPDWMWKNRPFYELVEWMRKRASSDGPYVFGMDCYCKEEAKDEVLNFFDFYDRENLGKEFRRTLYPAEQPDRWPDVLAKLQWEFQADSGSQPGRQQAAANGSCGSIVLASKKFRGCSKLDQFNVEQNLECMIAADEYYSKQRLEPPGSRASWNARDQHMMTTILRLRAHSRELFGLDDKDLKIIVWAHNSHVGDATATPMGGMNFERNEKWNLGQMCRSTLESVFIVGFYSFCGEVRAAKKWGGEGQVMSLTPAVPYSFEHRLHEWFPHQRAQFPLHKVREASKRFEYVPQKFPLNVEYRALHPMVRVSKEVMPQNQSVEAEEVGGDGSLKHKHPTLDPTKPFTAVSRTQVGKQGEVVRLQIRGYDRGQYDGWWVTEYTRHGSRTIHCLPSSHLKALSGPLPTPEKARALANFPILQRWVGVQYHPETEIESHYGEMAIARCYDLAVFVDKTRALDIDMTASTPLPVSAALNEGEKQAPTESAGAGSRHNRRLLMEYRRILKNPIEYIEARPLDTNILEWHFVITGNQDPYTGGKYHGILEFPDDFPMKPPSIKMLTPSGRFEINKRICLSMSDFHKESWNPSWTVEKILIGLMSFMYEENSVSIGSILEPKEDRRRYAAASAYFNAQNEIYVQLFQTPDEAEEEDNIRKLRRVAEGEVSEAGKACRYCLVESGELVAPCECKGSGQWVHLSCLRQWQKSVLLTQSTHPKYQTRIDEICNVCERPFKEAYKPRSRREALLEYTGEELPQLIQKGNLLASSRPKSEKNGELMRQQPGAFATRLGHFTEAVYLIALCEPYNPNKRGGGAVLGVNLVQKVPSPLEHTTRPVLQQGPDVEVTTYPLREWQSSYAPLVQVLQAARVLAPRAVEHFLGGPVEPSEAFALVEIPTEVLDAAKRASNNFAVDPGIRRQLASCFELLSPQRIAQLSRLRVKGSIYFGELGVILGLLASIFVQVGAGDGCLLGDAPLKVFWGYASWNATQLLGEIARRGWGLVVTDANMSFSTWEQTVASWRVVVDKSIVARESEYSN